MKLSIRLILCVIFCTVVCATPNSLYSNQIGNFSVKSEEIVASLIPAFCVGSVLGTFWSYVDSIVIPSSLRYVTTFPVALCARYVIVNTVSAALKQEKIEHDKNLFFFATWIWEWYMYKKLSR
ncbi:MAG: hypothetical protein ACOYT8_04570 [Candidatus Dependentiae bacterium]